MLEEKQQLPFLKALFAYALDGTDPAFKSTAEKAMFTLIKANLDSCNKRYATSVENGKKGGRPPKNEAEEKPKKTPAKTQAKPNDNPKDKVNENDNVNGNSHLRLEKKNASARPAAMGGGQPLERIEKDGVTYEYYLADNGEKRVRKIANDTRSGTK